MKHGGLTISEGADGPTEAPSYGGGSVTPGRAELPGGRASRPREEACLTGLAARIIRRSTQRENARGKRAGCDQVARARTAVGTHRAGEAD